MLGCSQQDGPGCQAPRTELPLGKNPRAGRQTQWLPSAPRGWAQVPAGGGGRASLSPQACKETQVLQDGSRSAGRRLECPRRNRPVCAVGVSASILCPDPEARLPWAGRVRLLQRCLAARSAAAMAGPGAAKEPYTMGPPSSTGCCWARLSPPSRELGFSFQEPLLGTQGRALHQHSHGHCHCPKCGHRVTALGEPVATELLGHVGLAGPRGASMWADGASQYLRCSSKMAECLRESSSRWRLEAPGRPPRGRRGPLRVWGLQRGLWPEVTRDRSRSRMGALWGHTQAQDTHLWHVKAGPGTAARRGQAPCLSHHLER